MYEFYYIFTTPKESKSNPIYIVTSVTYLLLTLIAKQVMLNSSKQ